MYHYGKIPQPFMVSILMYGIFTLISDGFHIHTTTRPDISLQRSPLTLGYSGPLTTGDGILCWWKPLERN